MFWCFDDGVTPPPYRGCAPFATKVAQGLAEWVPSHSSPIPNREACPVPKFYKTFEHFVLVIYRKGHTSSHSEQRS